MTAMQPLYHFVYCQWFEQIKENSYIKNIFGSLPQNCKSVSGQVHYSVWLNITQHLQNIFSRGLLIITTKNHTVTVKREP